MRSAECMSSVGMKLLQTNGSLVEGDRAFYLVSCTEKNSSPGM